MGKNLWVRENGEPLPLWLRYTDLTLQPAAEAQPVAQTTGQQTVYLTRCAQSPMSAVLDSWSLPDGRDEEFEGVKTELFEVGKLNAMTELNGILASLQVIDEDIDWEDITDNLIWGDNDDYPIEDEADEAMQMR